LKECRHPRRPILRSPADKLGEIVLTAKSVIRAGRVGQGGRRQKSTIAACIALVSSRLVDVGLLDSDVYGPSVPHLLGVTAGRNSLNKSIRRTAG